MTSHYKSAADKAQEQLDEISPSMCFAKWSQVSLHLTNGMTHSCYHPPTHRIDVEEIRDNPSALHNTKQKKQERALMLSGERPSGCSYCWRIEDAGAIADRVYRSGEDWAQNSREDIVNAGSTGDINPRYIEVNFNQACNFKCSYCSPHLSTTWEKEIKQFGAYDIVDGEHNNIDSLTRSGLMPTKTSQADNPYVQAFWKWWPQMYENLEVFRMTGGEPLMDSNTFKVLDYVYDHPNKNLELSITSNMCPPKQELFDKFIQKVQRLADVKHSAEVYVQDPFDGTEWPTWQHYIIGSDQKEYHDSDLPAIEKEDIKVTFPEEMGPCLEEGDNTYNYLYMYNDKAYKNFSLFVSLDGWGEQAEYIRNGLDFDQLHKNTHRFLDETRFTTVNFINTFNVLSLPSFIDFLQGILDLRQKWSKQAQYDMGIEKPHQRIWFDIPLLRAPEWQCIQSMPSEFAVYLEEAIEFMLTNQANESIIDYTGFKDFEIDKAKRNLAWMKEGEKLPQEQQQRNLANFHKFFSEHDLRRGTSFMNTFPELHDWWRKCEEASLII